MSLLPTCCKSLQRPPTRVSTMCVGPDRSTGSRRAQHAGSRSTANKAGHQDPRHCRKPGPGKITVYLNTVRLDCAAAVLIGVVRTLLIVFALLSKHGVLAARQRDPEGRGSDVQMQGTRRKRISSQYIGMLRKGRCRYQAVSTAMQGTFNGLRCLTEKRGTKISLRTPAQPLIEPCCKVRLISCRTRAIAVGVGN